MSRHGTYDLKYGFIPDEDCPEPQKQQTNYDRLVSKTPEELADELLDLFSAFYSVEWSKDTLLAWLKSPEEDNGT